MTRSLKKGFYVNEKILKKIIAMNASGEKKVFKVRDRACQIVPEMIGFTLAVHNGKAFISLYINEEMIGHRLGEFVPTRTFKGHPF